MDSSLTGALGDLAELVLRSAIWTAVSHWLRQQPPEVVVLVLAIAGVGFVVLRASRRRGVRSRR